MVSRCKTLCLATLRSPSQVYSRCIGSISKSEVTKRRNEIFDEEKKRQRSNVGRIEKIEVKYLSPQTEATLVMNKNLSTPHDCTKHISESVASVAALAMVDGKPWDMNKPLVNDCELKILSMNTPESFAVNNAFWRTCSLILGCVANSAFKDNIQVHLHSFVYPVIRSGSFTYDVHVDLPNWKPTRSELQAMSALFLKVVQKQLLCERLKVPQSVASEIFKDNPFKLKQIPSIASKNENSVILYRIGDHIDISKGPMVGNTGIIGRCTVTAIHKVESEESDRLYRFQGVAIPRGILINHFAYGILEERARKLNQTMWVPQSIRDEESEDELAAHASQ